MSHLSFFSGALCVLTPFLWCDFSVSRTPPPIESNTSDDKESHTVVADETKEKIGKCTR